MSAVEANFVSTKLRSIFKSDMTLQLSIFLLATIVVIGLTWLFIFTQYFARPAPIYFQENENGQIIEPAPLDQEGISKPTLLNWVNDFVMDGFNFNYSNVDRQISMVSDYLSDKALQQYFDIFTTDQDFRTIKENQFVVWVTPTKPPEIITGKPFRGRYAWQIRLQIIITFGNAARKGSQKNTIDLLVLRVPETENPLGVKIASFTRQVTARSSPQPIRRGF